jgi:hypothetical protein
MTRKIKNPQKITRSAYGISQRKKNPFCRISEEGADG